MKKIFMILCFSVFTNGAQAVTLCGHPFESVFQVSHRNCSVTVLPAVNDNRMAGQFVPYLVADGANQLACFDWTTDLPAPDKLLSVDFHFDTYPYDGVIDSIEKNIAQHSLETQGYFWKIDQNQNFIWGDVRYAAADDIYVCLNFAD